MARSITRRISSSGYVLLILLGCAASCCYGFGTFGFDIHHRYSDPVKGILAVDELPEKGSFRYYSAMAHRDRFFRGRRLAAESDRTPLTFLEGNETYRISSLGFLHYANVTIGTPALWFLVALDTGSDLFWLPCDCTSCLQGLNTSTGGVLDLNIYSPNVSSTSSKIPCNSSFCERESKCRSTGANCPYQVRYLSDGTTSTGILVQDVLHLTTDTNQSKAVKPRIPFGCGQVQTGSFMDGAAPNGLFGLGMDKISVPSILAAQGLIADSFSMCFGIDGVGRITFGDKGSSGQGETPFYLRQSHPTYNITITRIGVGGNDAHLEFNAIFDSGTSFTYLNDPAYTQIAESFNSLAKETRYNPESGVDVPFEYCYALGSNQTRLSYPVVNFTMKGGDQFYVNNPVMLVFSEDAYFYCLGIVKSEDVNIIGQNFMTGYRIVFDREKKVLGWKSSNCYNIDNSSMIPVDPPRSASVPPATAVNPEATAENGTNTAVSKAAPLIGNHLLNLHLLPCSLLLILIPFFLFFNHFF